jgi:DNA-directed RNA polymerase I, II, and III subunit RPABC2
MVKKKTVSFKKDIEDVIKDVKNIDINDAEEVEDDIDNIDDNDAEDDGEFFNDDSYNAFTKRNGIELLSETNYTNNDLHKIEITTPNDRRITSEIMTLAEYTRVISERAKQIENGSMIFVDLEGLSNPIKIAEMEILQKKSPIKVIRYITSHIKEIYSVNEMVVPFSANK